MEEEESIDILKLTCCRILHNLFARATENSRFSDGQSRMLSMLYSISGAKFIIFVVFERY